MQSNMIFLYSEIMGYCNRSTETDPNDIIYNVHGWQYHLIVSNHDGRDDVSEAS